MRTTKLLKFAPLVLLVAYLAIPADAQAQTFKSSAGPLKVVTVAHDLSHPWSPIFLPNGRMLVTERSGRLRIVTRNGGVGVPVRGLPKIAAYGQGGLLDDVVDPGFATGKTIFFSFSEPGAVLEHRQVGALVRASSSRGTAPSSSPSATGPNARRRRTPQTIVARSSASTRTAPDEQQRRPSVKGGVGTVNGLPFRRNCPCL